MEKALEYLKKGYEALCLNANERTEMFEGRNVDDLKKDFEKAIKLIESSESQEATTKESNLPIEIVIGSYYWVMSRDDEECQPAVVVDHLNKGKKYFKYLNGSVEECHRACKVKKL